MTQTFDELKAIATSGPFHYDATGCPTVNTPKQKLAVVMTPNPADEIIITRLLNAFVHNDGVKAIRDFVGEADLGEVDLEPEDAEKVEALRAVLAILDGEK